LTVGLPLDSEIWLRDWVIVMQNVITACKKTTANSSILTILMLTIKTVKSKPEKPFTSDGKKDEERNWQLNFY
jgi:hypothetical protein